MFVDGVGLRSVGGGCGCVGEMRVWWRRLAWERRGGLRSGGVLWSGGEGGEEKRRFLALCGCLGFW